MCNRHFCHFVIGGANKFTAWGVTNSHHDDIDFFLEKIHPENRKLYLFNNKWGEMKSLKTSINVKGSEAVDYEIEMTVMD